MVPSRRNRRLSPRYTVPAGTRVLMALRSPISTKNAQPGAPVYAQTTFPVTIESHLVIPAGSYVQGTVDRVQRPGKVRGTGQLQVHFTTLIFQNRYTVSLPGSLSGVPGGEDEHLGAKEGEITENSTKGRDAATVAGGAVSGATLGAVVGGATGNLGKGVGIGSGAGAAAGLLAVLFTRGPDVRFDVGTPIEMTLARPLVVECQGVNNPAIAMQPVQTNHMLDKPDRQRHVPIISPGASRLPFPY
ncbi:MAG: hypothetical protein NVS9B15_06610 [Acidobacteriaceae bacterium]